MPLTLKKQTNKLRKSLYFRNTRSYFERACTAFRPDVYKYNILYCIILYCILLHIISGYQCDKAMTKNDTREVI